MRSCRHASQTAPDVGDISIPWICNRIPTHAQLHHMIIYVYTTLHCGGMYYPIGQGHLYRCTRCDAYVCVGLSCSERVVVTCWASHVLRACCHMFPHVITCSRFGWSQTPRRTVRLAVCAGARYGSLAAHIGRQGEKRLGNGRREDSDCRLIGAMRHLLRSEARSLPRATVEQCWRGSRSLERSVPRHTACAHTASWSWHVSRPQGDL